jgi:FKBP-type peptidyl-prolyl cis-trans isomerase SlyD
MGQTVQPGKFVSLKYTIHSMDGKLLFSTGDEAEVHEYGSGGLARGLEAALAGKEVGAVLKLRLEPEQAFGRECSDAPAQPLPRVALPADAALRVGTSLLAETPEGEPKLLFVARVEEREVFVAAVHPYAGIGLEIEAEITGIGSSDS